MIGRRDLLTTGMRLGVGLGVSLLAAPAINRLARADTVVSLLEQANVLSRRPYQRARMALTAPFADLDYNAYRGIRPLPGRASMLPHGADFAFDVLPPGLYFFDRVEIDRVTPDGVEPMVFSPDLFSFDERYFADIPQTSPGAGFTGLRLRHPLNAPGQMDEFLVLQGASYFRAIGEAMVYGLSARALAVGTGGAQAEEFPHFTHLRLHPARAGTVRIEGLIDSPSLAAHIDMLVQPGTQTLIDIVTTVLPRVAIADVGIAPLTSMYLKGPMLSAVSDDFRPRVHDNDVLVIENGAGETLWRPIANPARVETSAFADDNPVSFGLFQTRRQFEDFEDTEARYHDRPSAVVRPASAWGPGAVMLVEIPTGDEFMDNIVAFWRPQLPLAAGGSYRFAYSLTWTRQAPVAQGLAPILQSRSGREHDRPGVRRFVVDIDAHAPAFVPDLSASGGATVFGVSAFALPERGGVRVTFLLEPGATDAAEIRLVLRAPQGQPLSAVWLHRWTRARDGGV